MTRYTIVFCVALTLLILGGCPPLSTGEEEGPVTAAITISAKSGPAPLQITVSGAASTSTAGDIVTYDWNFGNEATGTTSTGLHTFANPGRYNVSLTATDSAGNTDTTIVEVRVQGSEDITPVIQADQQTGVAPMLVHFDGSSSSAADDTIYDYRWNFGDGESSLQTDPWHLFENAGTYTVTLQVTTSGGVSATTTLDIEASQDTGYSLEFAGNQLATLFTPDCDALGAFTFQAYIKPQAGGTVATLGTSGVQIRVDNENNLVVVTKGEDSFSTAIPSLTGLWTHFSVSYNSATEEAKVYLNGNLVGTGTLEGTLSLTSINLGQGYVGKIDRIAFHSSEQTAAQIAAYVDSTPPNDGTRVGFWDCDSTMQTVYSTEGTHGHLGFDRSAEEFDADRSTDTPGF